MIDSKGLPDVTVVLICFNNGAGFLASLKSVVAAVIAAEHALRAEVIVVDDASDDAATRIMLDGIKPPLADFCVVRRVRNGGASAARNEGLRQARGRWVAFLDGDDLWTPRRLQLHAEVVDAHPNARWIGCDYVRSGADGSGVDPRPSRHAAVEAAASAGASAGAGGTHTIFALGEATEAALCGLLLHVNTVTIRRELLLAAGGFNERYRTAEDHDLWIRLSRIAVLHYVTEIGAVYTRNPQGITRRIRIPHPNLWKVYKACLEEPWSRPYRLCLIQRLTQVVVENVQVLRARRCHSDARRQLLAVLRHAPGSWVAWRQLTAVMLRRA